MTVSGCGGGDGDAESSGKKSEPSASPTASYFVRADTDAINAAAVKAQKTGATAQAAKQQKSCNKAGEQGYEQWRSCWHKLLDPFRKALAGLATQLGTLAEREFPEDCVTSLEAGEAAFTGFATQVDGLLRGIDSKRRVAQVRALRIYDTTLGEISKSFAEPFQAVTQVCYSPKDLASINASPRSSPNPARARAPERQTVTSASPRSRSATGPSTSAPSSVARTKSVAAPSKTERWLSIACLPPVTRR